MIVERVDVLTFANLHCVPVVHGVVTEIDRFCKFIAITDRNVPHRFLQSCDRSVRVGRGDSLVLQCLSSVDETGADICLLLLHVQSAVFVMGRESDLRVFRSSSACTSVDNVPC